MFNDFIYQFQIVQCSFSISERFFLPVSDYSGIFSSSVRLFRDIFYQCQIIQGYFLPVSDYSGIFSTSPRLFRDIFYQCQIFFVIFYTSARLFKDMFYQCQIFQGYFVPVPDIFCRDLVHCLRNECNFANTFKFDKAQTPRISVQFRTLTALCKKQWQCRRSHYFLFQRA